MDLTQVDDLFDFLDVMRDDELTHSEFVLGFVTIRKDFKLRRSLKFASQNQLVVCVRDMRRRIESAGVAV